MKPETREWVRKAEGDRQVAGREMKARRPVWNVICFLAQQSAEKYLKALLEEYEIPFRKTHDLVLLADSAASVAPELSLLSPQLARLTTFGIAARYPGADADRAAATTALTVAQTVRLRVRIALRLTDGAEGAHQAP